MYGSNREPNAKKLVKELQEMIEKHGDLPVYSHGYDYPERVSGVRYIPKDKGDGYVPGNSFYIG